MNKSIWLITHDNFIDRRIFFFAETFINMGFSVKLFPDSFFDLTVSDDPEYVLRPVTELTICTYNVELDSVDEQKRNFIHQIEIAQTRYFNEKGVYASSLRKLGIKTLKGCAVSFVAFKDFYLVSIRKDDLLIYNSASKQIQVNHDLSYLDSAVEIEGAIAKFIRDKKLEITTYDNIQVKIKINEYGEEVFFASSLNLKELYRYNHEQKQLIMQKPFALSTEKLDYVGNMTFDFEDFKTILFNYTSILSRVKEELQVETPYMVYVADLPTLPIGTMLKEAYGCKLMVDCHEWWYKQEHLWSANLPKREKISEKYEALLYSKCDILITVGKYLAEDMGKCYNKKFEIIYSCMSKSLANEEITSDSRELLARLSIPESAYVCIFQGGMTTLRNLDNLARATKYLSEDCYLIMVGSGAYEPEFRSILSKDGNPDRVRFAGWVNQTDLNKYTVCAHLGILPYHKVDDYFSYSVPNKLMEYFDARLPMLYDSSMKEISMVAGQNNVGVGVDLSNAKIFGNTIDQLLHDPDKLQEMKNNYEHCKNKFKFTSQAKELQRIMHQYLALEIQEYQSVSSPIL